MSDLQEKCAVVLQALNDWAVTYAPDMCGEDTVAQAKSRILEHGTFAYIAYASEKMREVIAALSEAEQREKDARRAALEEAALWHDSKVQEYADQIAVNDAYLARGGRLSSESRANEYCDDQRSTHRRSAAHLRSMVGRAALERSDG